MCVCSTITLEKFDYSLHLCVRAHMLILMRVAGRFCLKIGKWKSSGGRSETLRGKKREERGREREKYSAGDVTAGYFRLFLTASKRKRTVEGDKTETEGDLGRKRESERRKGGKDGQEGKTKKNCRG